MQLEDLYQKQEELINIEFSTRSTATKENYNIIITKFLEWFEKYEYNEITTTNAKDILNNYRNYLIKKENTITNKNLSHYTINQYIKKIQYFLNYCDIKTQNIKLFKGAYDKTKRENITKKDFQNILYYAPDTRTKIILHLLFYTGIRVNELVNITLEQYIHSPINNNNNKIIEITGKGSKQRHILITSSLDKEISEYIKTRKKEHKYLIAPLRTNNNKPITTNQIRKIIKDTCKTTDHALGTNYASTVTPHVLRHSYAVYLLQKNISVNSLQRLLGHSSLTITSIYTNINDSTALTELENLLKY